MKGFFEMLAVISIVCLSGDSNSFTGFLIWEAVWLMIFSLSIYMMYREDRNEGN